MEPSHPFQLNDILFFVRSAVFLVTAMWLVVLSINAMKLDSVRAKIMSKENSATSVKMEP